MKNSETSIVFDKDFERMKLCLTFKWLQNVGRMRALASATPEVNTGLLMQALIARILAPTKGGGQDSLGKLSNISEVSLDRSNGVKTSRKCGYVDTMWSKKTTCPLESITTRSQGRSPYLRHFWFQRCPKTEIFP